MDVAPDTTKDTGGTFLHRDNFTIFKGLGWPLLFSVNVELQH